MIDLILSFIYLQKTTFVYRLGTLKSFVFFVVERQNDFLRFALFALFINRIIRGTRFRLKDWLILLVEYHTFRQVCLCVRLLCKITNDIAPNEFENWAPWRMVWILRRNVSYVLSYVPFVQKWNVTKCIRSKTNLIDLTYFICSEFKTMIEWRVQRG